MTPDRTTDAATASGPTRRTPGATAPAATRPWQRAVIESVTPQVDGGRFAAKRCVGDLVTVDAPATEP